MSVLCDYILDVFVLLPCLFHVVFYIYIVEWNEKYKVNLNVKSTGLDRC
jgi:hypothetical protein